MELKKIFRVYLECAHLAFLTTLVVLVVEQTSSWNTNTGGIPKFKLEFK